MLLKLLPSLDCFYCRIKQISNSTQTEYYTLKRITAIAKQSRGVIVLLLLFLVCVSSLAAVSIASPWHESRMSALIGVSPVFGNSSPVKLLPPILHSVAKTSLYFQSSLVSQVFSLFSSLFDSFFLLLLEQFLVFALQAAYVPVYIEPYLFLLVHHAFV